MTVGAKSFEIGKKTYIMGILNFTPDSFYDGGKYASTEAAIRRALEMVGDGADIIDVGGESTRPLFTPVSAQEETDRVCGVIEAVKKNADITVSCDTYKASVASAAVKAGADIINSVYAFDKDEELAAVTAKSGAAFVLTANLNADNTDEDITNLVFDRFNKNLRQCADAGIAKDKIILDPGLGFFRGAEDDLKILSNLKAFLSLGYPLLLGASNKSFIGKSLSLPLDERLSATVAVSAYAVLSGVSFLRVHNVRENRQAVDIIERITQS